MGSERSAERSTDVAQDGARARGFGAFAAGPGAPARSRGPSPTAVLALQRTIGNARVGRVLRRRMLQRTYADDFRTLLGQAPFLGDPDAASALAALQGPALQQRQFTRHDVARWVGGQATVQEWTDVALEPLLTPLLNIGQSPPLAAHVTDFNNREALRELQDFATRQRNELDALLAAGGGAGAPWTQKFTGMRGAVHTLKTRADAMDYGTQLGAAVDQDEFRTRFAAQAQGKLDLLHGNQAQIGVAGRLKFSQKRANARFSSAATVHNEATNALVRTRLVTDVAQDLRNGTISPDAIPVQVFNHGADLVAINNRGLAALSLAGMRPTRIIHVANPSTEITNRLGESDTYTSANGPVTITAPDYQMALTMTDANTDRHAVAVPVTV